MDTVLTVQRIVQGELRDGNGDAENEISNSCSRPRHGQGTAQGWRDGSNHDEFSTACALPPVAPLAPEQIKQIREASRVSQAVFATLLNTSLSTVQKWEIGTKRPTGTALKLLHLVQDHGLEVVA